MHGVLTTISHSQARMQDSAKYKSLCHASATHQGHFPRLREGDDHSGNECAGEGDRLRHLLPHAVLDGLQQ